MSDLIERVAKAIYDANYVQGMPWSLLTEARKEVNRTQARAAIEAMREPTEKMVEAFDAAAIITDEWGVDREIENTEDAYRAMIDAALGGRDADAS